MGHSFFWFKDKWVRESDWTIEVGWWSFCRSLAAISLQWPEQCRLREKAAHLWTEYKPQGPGMYGLHLERLLDSEQSCRLFVAAIDAAVAELETFGTIIPAATLNAHLGSPPH